MEDPKKSPDSGAVAPVVWIVLASVAALIVFAVRVLGGRDASVPVPERIRIAAAGYSTNDLGERCAVLRIHNGNRVPMLGLTYMDAFPNRPALSMPLPASGEATGMLSFPTNPVASAVKVTCYVEDRRWYIRAAMAIEQWRTGRKQPVHRVLFVVPGPVVGP